VPLPEAEVGAGAKWQVRKPIKNEGMTIDQTESYELVSVEGDGFTARTTVTQNAANQKISSPAMPGMKVDLTKLSGTGSGTLKADLGQIVLNEARMTNHSDLQMAMGTGAQKQTITTKVDITLEIQRK
jgi:hypothetical protein